MTLEHRYYPGTVAASLVTSAYALTAWPLAADQGSFPWMEPVDPSGNVHEYDAQVEALSGPRIGIGLYNWSWLFGYWTPGMAQVARTQMFPTNGWWEFATVVTWSKTHGWIAVQATAQWNDPAKSARSQPVIGGWLDGKIDFVDGVVIATSTGAYSSGYSSGYEAGGFPT